MLVTILAVTKAFDRFCIAGLTEDGSWVRPIPTEQKNQGNPEARFWTREQLMFGGEFIEPGDVWEIEGYSPTKFLHQNHVEDFVVTKYRYIKTKDNAQVMRFLGRYKEENKAFIDTLYGKGRSICLVKVRQFSTEIFEWNGEKSPKIYLYGSDFNLNNPHVKYANYKLKDCRWAGLIMQNYSVPHFDEIYATIGLATSFRGTEYPQVIGLHTSPQAPYPDSYPDE